MPSFAKELMMKELEKEFKNSSCAFFSSFKALSVADISEFRRTVEKVSKRSMVLKHAMAKKIFSASSLGEAESFLKGQVLVTFASGEPQVVSKTIVDFAKKNNDKLAPAGLIFENKVYNADYVKQLAKLPSRREMLTQVVIRVKSPISGFVMTLSQVLRGFVTALGEIKKLKEAQTQAA